VSTFIAPKVHPTTARAGAVGCVVVGVEIDDVVAELLGGRTISGPVGALLGDHRGPPVIAAALVRVLALDGGRR